MVAEEQFMKLFFTTILMAMLAVTTFAILDRGMFDAAGELWQSWWFRATLADAYFGFITFFVWVAYKERSWLKKILWFILIMTLGNIAMSAYVLIELCRKPRGDSFASFLTRQNA